MLKKKIATWIVDSTKDKKEKVKLKKIRQVENEILLSRLNKEYRDLGEHIFRIMKKTPSLIPQSLKLKKHLDAIKNLLIEKKKLEK